MKMRLLVVGLHLISTCLSTSIEVRKDVPFLSWVQDPTLAKKQELNKTEPNLTTIESIETTTYVANLFETTATTETEAKAFTEPIFFEKEIIIESFYDETPSTTINPTFLNPTSPNPTLESKDESELNLNLPQEHRQVVNVAPNETENEDTTGSSVEKPDKQAEFELELKRMDRDLNIFIRKTLEDMREAMRSGRPDLNMPILDPLHLDDRDLSPIIGNDIFDVKMDKVKFNMISNFQVISVDSRIKDMRIKVGIHFPMLVGESDFSANGTIFEVFHVSGKGNATLDFQDVYARTVIYLTQENGKLKVDSADQPYVDFSAANVKLKNNEKASRKLKQYGVANQLAPILFWIFAADIADSMDQYLAAYINDALQKFPLPEVIQNANLSVRVLRVHVPTRPMPYAYISPSYFRSVKSAP